MTLYAVHHAWIDGHAVKAPVGIWSEGGVSYYPPQTASHRNDGSQAETEASERSWAEWVEMRTEWGSTYGASWSAVESDEPMEQILGELQADFFAEPHPVGKLYISSDGGITSKEDSDDTEEDFEATANVNPAKRFVIAQSWWVASELARRHPELIVHETHPGDGMYDVLSLSDPSQGDYLERTRIMLNRNGTLQVHPPSGSERSDIMIGPWANVIASRSPHQQVKVIERAAGLGHPAKAPASTPRVLSYRLLATLLALNINDRHPWDARQEFVSSSDDASIEQGPHFKTFPTIPRELVRTPIVGQSQDTQLHFWILLRGAEPVAAISSEGCVYRKDKVVNLADHYKRHGRKLLPIVVSAFGDLLA